MGENWISKWAVIRLKGERNGFYLSLQGPLVPRCRPHLGFPHTRPFPYLISSESAPLIPKKPCGIAVPPGMKPRNLVLFTFSPAVSDEIYTSGTFNTPNGGCNVFRWYDNIYECSARIYPELV